jgi:alpha-galactosidase
LKFKSKTITKNKIMTYKRLKIIIYIAAFSVTIYSCTGNSDVRKSPSETENEARTILAPLPPMGWNSWNPFGENVSEKVIKETADAFVSSGLKDAGYTYIVIDDIWQGGRDSTTGLLYPDPERFPSGIKALADYVHSKGLKFGIYSDAGTLTCGDRPASFGYEEKDARLFAEWGVDYLKYDYCYCPDYASENNDYKMAVARYKAMGDALKATGRPIVFSICEWGPRSPWLWGREVGGQLWRVSYDVGDKWDEPRNEHSQIGILTAIDVMCNLERFAGPDGWNDPDMLVIGLKNSGFIKGGGCTYDEYRSQMSMWCMFSAPLMMGCPVNDMSKDTKSILLNKDIIAIDQDPLGKQAFRVWRLDGVEAWKKPLSGDRFALAFLNRNSVEKSVTVPVKQLELDPSVAFEVFNVWKHQAVKQNAGEMKVTMKSHETQVFVMNPAYSK